MEGLKRKFGLPVWGMALAMWAFRVQENAYGRFNEMRGVSESLGNPNWLTSFAYPLEMMYMVRAVMLLGEEETKMLGRSREEKLFRMVRKWVVPLGLALVNVGREMIARPNYNDDPFKDVMAGAAAAVFYMVSDRVFESREA